jgi:hypothetical protein
VLFRGHKASGVPLVAQRPARDAGMEWRMRGPRYPPPSRTVITMNEEFAAERLNHRGYDIVARPERNERGNWSASVEVTRDGARVALPEAEPTGPYWQTPQEALRAGVERAQYLLDRQDGLLERANPARET